MEFVAVKPDRSYPGKNLASIWRGGKTCIEPRIFGSLDKSGVGRTGGVEITSGLKGQAEEGKRMAKAQV